MAIQTRKSRDGKVVGYQAVILRLNPDGTHKRQIIGTYKTKTEAKSAYAKALVQREGGSLLEPSKTSVSELMDAWIKEKERTITPNTAADYRSTIDTHIKPALGTILITKLTAARVQAQYGAWEEAHRSPRTIRYCAMRLSQAFDHAVRMKMLLHNPIKDTTPPTLPPVPFDHWNVEESRRFLEHAVTNYYAPLWEVLLLEGMRLGEALGLRWRDINWEHGTAHISQTVGDDKSNKRGPVVRKRTKTRAGARTVVLTERTLKALRRVRPAWNARKLAAPTWQEDDLIFCTINGRPISSSNIRRNFTAIRMKADLRDITIHELRHTAATLMLLSGVPVKVVSERLGHASIAITLDTYAHVLPSMHQAAAAAMDRLLALPDLPGDAAAEQLGT